MKKMKINRYTIKKIAGFLLSASLFTALSFNSDALAAESAMDVIGAPSGIALNTDGSLLVTDTYNKVVWKVSGGTSTVYAGAESVKDLYGEPLGGYYDSTSDKALFGEPWGIAPFLDGYAVSDPKNQVVRFVNGSGVRTAVGSGTAGFTNGKGTKAALNNPTGLAADPAGNLYIADTNNQCIRIVTAAGNVSTYISNLSEPTGLCYKNGILYVADSGSNRILSVIGKTVTVLAGNGTEGKADGAVGQAQFSSPQGVAVGDDGIIYVSDTGNRSVRKIENGIVTTIVTGDPGNLESSPTSPMGLLIMGDTLYVCDSFSNMLLPIKVK